MTGIPAKELLYSGFKKLLSEYEIASSSSSFPSVTFGKMNAFEGSKDPRYIGVVPY